MENVNGKEIPLQCVTVKVPGQRRPRGSRSILSLQGQESTPPGAKRRQQQGATSRSSSAHCNQQPGDNRDGEEEEG